MNSKTLHYLVLVIALTLGVVMFFYTQGSPTFQRWVGVATSIFYVAWGLIYHAINGDLHFKVVVEYMLIGAIAVALFLTLI